MHPCLHSMKRDVEGLCFDIAKASTCAYVRTVTRGHCRAAHFAGVRARAGTAGSAPRLRRSCGAACALTAPRHLRAPEDERMAVPMAVPVAVPVAVLDARRAEARGQPPQPQVEEPAAHNLTEHASGDMNTGRSTQRIARFPNLERAGLGAHNAQNVRMRGMWLPQAGLVRLPTAPMGGGPPLLMVTDAEGESTGTRSARPRPQADRLRPSAKAKASRWRGKRRWTMA